MRKFIVLRNDEVYKIQDFIAKITKEEHEKFLDFLSISIKYAHEPVEILFEEFEYMLEQEKQYGDGVWDIEN